MNSRPKKKNASRSRISLWRRFVAAARFLTRIWLPFSEEPSARSAMEALRGGVVFFPIVGGLVGLFTAAVFLAAVWGGASPLLAAFIAIGLEALVTGAFHEDAFADACDALGGGWSREQILKIMKDSRIGAYGAVGLIVGVGARAAAMAALIERGEVWAAASLVAAATIGRIAIVAMMAAIQPISDGNPHTKDVAGRQTLFALVIAVVTSAPFWLPWFVVDLVTASITMAVVVCVFIGFHHTIRTRVGGSTGDLLGCTAFLVQLLVTIGASMK